MAEVSKQTGGTVETVWRDGSGMRVRGGKRIGRKSGMRVRKEKGIGRKSGEEKEVDGSRRPGGRKK